MFDAESSVSDTSDSGYLLGNDLLATSVMGWTAGYC